MMVGVVLATPFFASAQSLTDVFTQDGVAQNGCLDLKYNLGYRSRDVNTNGSVSDLQDFLVVNKYLSGDPTGYFGVATLAAVKKFQITTGLATYTTPGFGGIGPKSRAKIKAMTCGGEVPATTATQTAVTEVGVLPAGCNFGDNFSRLTGKRCIAETQTTVPAGCNFGDNFSRLTGKKCVAEASILSEQVKCVFKSESMQKCWGDAPSVSVGSPITQYSCSGVGTCVINVKGKHGTPITWGSSCGGSENTTIDGNNELSSFGGCSVNDQETTMIPKVSISLSSERVRIDEKFTINWKSENADSCKIEISDTNGKEIDRDSVPTSGSEYTSVSSRDFERLGNNITFVLVCENKNGKADASAKLYVTATATGEAIPSTTLPVVNFSFSKTDIVVGEKIGVKWSSSGADSCGMTLKGTNGIVEDSSAVPTSGGDESEVFPESVLLKLGKNPTYTLTCKNSAGETSKSVTINLSAAVVTTPVISLELPIVTPAPASAGLEWVKNMKDTFKIFVTVVALPNIYVTYANMPPSGVNIVRADTGKIVWRQVLTTSDGYSGKTSIALPDAIAKDPAYFGQYYLQVFGHDNYIYATSDVFYLGTTSNSVVIPVN